MAGPMTFEDLSEVYRSETKSAGLTKVRMDLYQQMDALLESLRREVKELSERDPGGAVARNTMSMLPKAEDLCKAVREKRVQKTVQMSLLSAKGSDLDISMLTGEERALYRRVRKDVESFGGDFKEESGTGFAEAVAASVKDGSLIRRGSMPEGMVLKAMDVYRSDSPVIHVRTRSTAWMVWTPFADDVAATDWEILKG